MAIVPEAEQRISYGMPAFKLRGKTIAGFAAFKNHLSYLPHSGSVIPRQVAGAGVRLPARKLDPARLRAALHHAIGLRPGAQRIAAAFPPRAVPLRQPTCWSSSQPRATTPKNCDQW
jgi:hypothetical protein